MTQIYFVKSVFKQLLFRLVIVLFVFAKTSAMITNLSLRHQLLTITAAFALIGM